MPKKGWFQRWTPVQPPTEGQKKDMGPTASKNDRILKVRLGRGEGPGMDISREAEAEGMIPAADGEFGCPFAMLALCGSREVVLDYP
ncbi:hypothetical protein Aduo_009325 [Ancylostoma duodenale]